MYIVSYMEVKFSFSFSVYFFPLFFHFFAVVVLCTCIYLYFDLWSERIVKSLPYGSQMNPISDDFKNENEILNFIHQQMVIINSKELGKH